MTNTKEEVKSIRPEITLESMNLDKVQDAEFYRDDCMFASIPLKRSSDNFKVYDSAFECFLKQYVNDGNDADEIIDYTGLRKLDKKVA